MCRIAFALVLLVSLPCVAKDQKEYETGKLVDVKSENYQQLISNTSTGSAMSVRRVDNWISVRLGDLVFVGECIQKPLVLVQAWRLGYRRPKRS
jgi:hypothetical protein